MQLLTIFPYTLSSNTWQKMSASNTTTEHKIISLKHHTAKRPPRPWPPPPAPAPPPQPQHPCHFTAPLETLEPSATPPVSSLPNQAWRAMLCLCLPLKMSKPTMNPVVVWSESITPITHMTLYNSMCATSLAQEHNSGSDVLQTPQRCQGQQWKQVWPSSFQCFQHVNLLQPFGMTLKHCSPGGLRRISILDLHRLVTSPSLPRGGFLRLQIHSKLKDLLRYPPSLSVQQTLLTLLMPPKKCSSKASGQSSTDRIHFYCRLACDFHSQVSAWRAAWLSQSR